VSRRIGPAALLRDFHRTRQELPVEVVTLFDARSAIEAVASGEIDATFRCVMAPEQLPEGIKAARVLDESHLLLTGPRHELAGADSVTPAQLSGYRIWIPGIVPGTEWAAYYQELAGAFGLKIEASGPNFGTESLLETLAESAGLASLMGDRVRLTWPAECDLRRIAVRDPVPAYPHSLVWRAGNRHPALAALREFCDATWHQEPGTWVPESARSEVPRLPSLELALHRPVGSQSGYQGQGGEHGERAAAGTAPRPPQADGKGPLREQNDNV